MKRFWTTAAVAALCAFGADAWAAPPTAHLELVASHSAGDSDDSGTHARHHRHRGEAHKAAHARRSRGERSEETPSRARRGRHHAEQAAETESHGRHGRRGRRHAAEQAAEPVLRGRHGRHRAAEETAVERPERGRHGRRREAAPSEIRTEGGSVKVGRHDTLESIAGRTGVSVQELARLNHLHRPYHVRRGERLKLPERRYYIVRSGETLYSLARKFGVQTSELADANGLAAGRHLRAGQKLYLPGGAVEAAPPAEEAPSERLARRSERREPAFTEPFAGSGRATPPTGETAAQPPAPTRPVTIPPGPSPYQPVPPAQPPAGQPATPPSARPSAPSTPAPNPADVAAAGRGRFVWPVQGQVLSPFGHKADGSSNDGLNIAGAAGDPVRAAADGEVVYAGDQVPSFGNLVLIKHPGGWVTAYAHMGKILVKNRDAVVQGQQIGVIGQTGAVDRPQVHFEIRYAPSPKDKATPVDPTLILPQR